MRRLASPLDAPQPDGAGAGLRTEELAALDDRRLRFRLKSRFPLLLDALAVPSNPQPFIMPARLAATDPFQQIREPTGSGPFRFVMSEFRQGARAVWERNPDYVPSPGGGSGLTAGPKIVHFDRVEWTIIPDAGTAAAALAAGEVDWLEQMPAEIQMLLGRNRGLLLEPIDPLPLPGQFRFNHRQPPFDNPAIRRAFLPAISQEDFMTAIVGPDPAKFVKDMGFFTPGSPFASDEGLEPLKGPRSIEQARQALKAAGYKGELVRLIGTTDIISTTAQAQVAADLLRRLEINADVVLTDWGTVAQRRMNKGPLDQGGWSIACFATSGMDFVNPVTHLQLRSDGANAAPGWPDLPEIEALRAEWLEAPDLAGAAGDRPAHPGCGDAGPALYPDRGLLLDHRASAEPGGPREGVCYFLGYPESLTKEGREGKAFPPRTPPLLFVSWDPTRKNR